MRKYDENNVFWKIINNLLPVNKLYEDDNILAFKDLHPVAKEHVLVIPKEAFTDFEDFISNSKDPTAFFKSIPLIAEKCGLKEYRLITNKGSLAGQTVFHFHIHIIGGEQLYGLVGAKLL